MRSSYDKELFYFGDELIAYIEIFGESPEKERQRLKRLARLALDPASGMEGDDAAITLAELGIKVVRPERPPSNIVPIR